MCNSYLKIIKYCFLVFAAYCILTTSPALAHQIYFNDFEAPVGPEWSNTTKDITPVGARTFLGQFDNETVSLTLASVSAGNVTVSFELFIIDTWDGHGDEIEDPSWGPDVWDCSVGGGPTLLNTTFATHVPRRQAYPDTYPGDLGLEPLHPHNTGAVEVGTLGYGLDAVYNLNFTFPHAGGSLVLNFSAFGLQGIGDESWGLDNVLVDVEKKVEIDIKPGSDPNPINPGSNGLVPVAILSSPDFDATTVDPTTVELAGASVAVRGKSNKSMSHQEDVNGDGLDDLVVQVETQSFADLGEGGTVELTGTTFSGEDIVGYDDVIIVPPKPVLIETVTVYSNDIDGEDSTVSLLDGVDYRIEVSGTWTNKTAPDTFPVDAEYVSYDGWISWQDGPDPTPDEPGERKNQLDLQETHISDAAHHLVIGMGIVELAFVFGFWNALSGKIGVLGFSVK